MRSIRQFLIANLLIGILFATNLAILSNLYFGYQSIRPHLDAQMVIMAHSIDLFLPNDGVAAQNIAQQQVIDQYKNNKTTLQDYHIHDQAYLAELQHSLNSIQFHVYSAEHTILARSPQAPEAPAALKTGFSTTQIHGEQWRVFKLITPSKKTVVIFHPMHARQYIQDNINTKAIIMTLLTIPPWTILVGHY